MKAAIAFLLLALLAGGARADMIWHDAYKSPFSSWSAYMYDQNVKRHLRERTASDAAPAQPAQHAPMSATDFRRAGKRRDVVAQLVASLPDAERAQLDATLRSTMAQLGAAGRKDNVANAMAIVIGLSYMVIEKPDFDASKADELVPVINDALAASPQWKRIGAADRQLMYDSLLLSAAVIAIVHQSGDRDTSRAIAKQVLQHLVGASE
jgi:hypothetical protein